MDEVHALSNQAWQAMLKVLEEPPVKSIFIMCTTDPQKIPKTILSRVQRFDFQRISQEAILDRLAHIVSEENVGGDTEEECAIKEEALNYIARMSGGGMRDALTMLDKCLAYSSELTLDNVIKALGIADYSMLCRLLVSIAYLNTADSLDIINQVYMSGYDLKQFIKSFTNFVLDYSKWYLGATEYISCPLTDEVQNAFEEYRKSHEDEYPQLLTDLIKLQADIKWETNPKSRIEAWCITGE
jgi:DNA polymerase-3 subunit gamma/tau